MHIGGVLIGSGMVMSLEPDDYLYGSAAIKFTVGKVLGTLTEWGTDWVLLEGWARPTAVTVWETCRIQVRIIALKRALSF